MMMTKTNVITRHVSYNEEKQLKHPSLHITVNSWSRDLSSPHKQTVWYSDVALIPRVTEINEEIRIMTVPRQTTKSNMKFHLLPSLGRAAFRSLVNQNKAK